MDRIHLGEIVCGREMGAFIVKGKNGQCYSLLFQTLPGYQGESLEEIRETDDFHGLCYKNGSEISFYINSEGKIDRIYNPTF